MTLIQLTGEHVLSALRESGAEEASWRYRWEHSLRVAAVGREIARAEGFDQEAMVLGCLLHDIGYARCRSSEDFENHGPIGAGMADEFLKSQGYDPEKTEAIRYGIWTHTQDEAQFPRPCTPFESSIVDADNIDRFDTLRMADTLAYFDLMKKRPGEILDICRRQIDRYTSYMDLPFGTKTALRLWRERLNYQLEYYRRLERQIHSGDDILNI